MNANTTKQAINTKKRNEIRIWSHWLNEEYNDTLEEMNKSKDWMINRNNNTM